MFSYFQACVNALCILNLMKSLMKSNCNREFLDICDLRKSIQVFDAQSSNLNQYEDGINCQIIFKPHFKSCANQNFMSSDNCNKELCHLTEKGDFRFLKLKAVISINEKQERAIQLIYQQLNLFAISNFVKF